jgi:hypothetical protein
MEENQQSEDLAYTAESEPLNRQRVKNKILSALKKSGAILPDSIVESITNNTLLEMADVRKRMAYMVYCFAEHCDGSYTREKMERLEFVLLCHRRDANNAAYLPEGMEDS